jgi:hypothetical protein
LKDARLPGRLSSHSFRVTTVTNLLEQGVPLEDVQRLVGHSAPRTTRLYDGRDQKMHRISSNGFRFDRRLRAGRKAPPSLPLRSRATTFAGPGFKPKQKAARAESTLYCR